jgi:hypothetical protein
MPHMGRWAFALPWLLISLSSTNILAQTTAVPVGVCGAHSSSYATNCAEDDNINIPLYGGRVDSFRIIATHPQYEVGVDNCQADFTGCGLSRASDAATDTCSPVFDDGINVVHMCSVPDWWRPFQMELSVAGRSASGHYLVLYRKVDGENSWPQYLVLYQDGNLRLKPQSPVGAPDRCFGSSVVIGPAAPAARPFVDIARVHVSTAPLALDVTFRNGLGTARFDLSVNRTSAIATIRPGYGSGPSIPFATFRSMWVSDGNSDADAVETFAGVFPIMANWRNLAGRSWFFHRRVRSRHNTSAPDIRIEAQDVSPQLLVDASPSSLRTGGTMRVAASVFAGVVSTPVDAYFALRVPGGSLLFLQPGPIFTSEMRPFVRSWSPVDLNATLVARAFEGWEPVGQYEWLSAFFSSAGELLSCIGWSSLSFTR